MKQIKDSIKNVKDKIGFWSKNRTQNITDWRNEHGQPNLKYLQSLAKDGSPRSLEKLKSIAQELEYIRVKFLPTQYGSKCKVYIAPGI